MGQQLRTNTKRRRRKDYLKRKKEQARASAAVKKSSPKPAKAPAKKAAKKVAKKAAKKVAKKVAEKVEAPAAEKVEAPAAEEAAAPKDLGLVYDEAPDSVDDLKEISGVGPALEGKLHGLGIYTYAQILAWTPENISAFDDLLSFKGRIERDEWLKQVAALEAAK